jgi:hypothetical protein
MHYYINWESFIWFNLIESKIYLEISLIIKMSITYNPIKMNILTTAFEKEDKHITILELYNIVLKAYDLQVGDNVNYLNLLKRMALDREDASKKKKNGIIANMFDVVMILIMYMSLKDTLSLEERRNILSKMMEPAKKLGFEIGN